VAADSSDKVQKLAETICLLGEHIGFFEFMVWGHLRERVVNKLFGNNLVSVTKMFGPPLDMVPLENACHVTAVIVAAKEDLIAARSDIRRVSHFVIAVPITCGRAVSSTSRLAAVAAWKAGFALKLTHSTEDCGIDCMTFYDGLSITEASFGTLRTELADFMVEQADYLVRQEVLGLCSESGQAHPEVSNKKVLDSGKGGMGPSTSSSSSYTSTSSGAASSSSSSIVGLLSAAAFVSSLVASSPPVPSPAEELPEEELRLRRRPAGLSSGFVPGPRTS
jgi:hypothetical protein